MWIWFVALDVGVHAVAIWLLLKRWPGLAWYEAVVYSVTPDLFWMGVQWIVWVLWK